MLKAECVILGGGLAGAATAYGLSRRGLRDVVVLEKEAHAGVHSSGRNAAMVRQVVPDPAVAELARRGADFIARAGERWSREPLFHPRGSLLLAGERRTDDLLRDLREARDAGLEAELWDRDRVVERVPALRGAPFDTAAFTPSDGVADVDALLRGFLAESRASGSRIVFSKRVDAIEIDGSGRVRGVRAGDLVVETPRVVDAAGAWASRLAEAAGASRLALVPHVRHLIHTGKDERVRSDWPFVWNIEDDVYFRPESGGLLVSPCDHTPSEPGDAQPSPAALELLARKLERAFPELREIRVARYWAGHRTFAPDGRFVIGPDPRLEGFFWVAGLGGHGVTTSAAVGELAARLILEPEEDASNPFSPSRFAVSAAR